MKRVWPLLLTACSMPMPMMMMDAGPPPPPPATEVAVGRAQACARLSDGTVRCWGKGSATPTAVAGAEHAVQLAVGDGFTCARFDPGTVKCWGKGDKGQLGFGDAGDSDAPLDVVGLTGAVELSAGDAHACARLSDHSVSCWGDNSHGQLGTASVAPFTPAPASAGTMLSAAQLDVGAQHACVVRVSGSIVCWGANALKQLGDGTMADRNSPVPTVGVGSGTQVSAGLTTCLKQDNGGVECWGITPELPDSNPTVHMGFGTVTDVSVGVGHVCARYADGGTVACAGANDAGQLGDGTMTSRSATSAVPGLFGVTQLAAGAGFTCALIDDGGVQCWGDNAAGQLGDGTMMGRPSPAPVKF
jgi:alpha-tubulin suppressor-like RCC1 family protein